MTGKRNVVITGFMGTGKSVVGRLVGNRLGRRFVDMDSEIAQTAGMSIPDVFKRHGEGHFRQLESDLCEALAKQDGLVIATGGGALTFAGNRDVMLGRGVGVCLTARPEVLWQRAGHDKGRPMLEASDRRERMEALLAMRAAAYAEVPHQVDTTDLTPEQVADRVVAIVETAERVGETVRTVRYPGGSYPIFITHGGLSAAGHYVASRPPWAAVAVVSDDTVMRRWGEEVTASFDGWPAPVMPAAFPAGEQSKTLATAEALIEGMVAGALGRDATVLALGGGVVGDTAGFAAAIYMRGVRFAQAPTTLLAMVDSSVGGKVAVDLPAGKNLVGSFKQPELVLIDLDALDTLPRAELLSGLAEALKAGVIGDPSLFEMLEGDAYDLAEVVRRALQVKIDIVQRDPYERGERALLNLGHTFGHAYETVSGYGLRHGEAVAIGMVLAARLAERRGLCPPALPERLRACLARLGLPHDPPALPVDGLIAAMRRDKKRQAGRLRFVLPAAIGDVRLVDDVSEDEVRALLAGAGA